MPLRYKMALRKDVLGALTLLLLTCGMANAHEDVTPQEALHLIDALPDLLVVDVREESEYCDEQGHIPGAVNYPWSSGVLEARYVELPLEGDILVVCRSGNRSNQAVEFLDAQGFTSVFDMTEGMSAWQGDTEACRSLACPVEVLLEGDEIYLAELRAFRNQVLLKSGAGIIFTRFYYRHAAKLSEVFSKNPGVRHKARRVLDMLRPFINELTKQTSVSKQYRRG